MSKVRSLLGTKFPHPFLAVARPLSITTKSRTTSLLLYAQRPRRREILKRHACVSGRTEPLAREHPGNLQQYLVHQALLLPNLQRSHRPRRSKRRKPRRRLTKPQVMLQPIKRPPSSWEAEAEAVYLARKRNTVG